MLFGALVVLFVIVCILLCLVVLIQSDKGGGISGALGGGLSGASALLGTQDTANILTRATTILATAYMVLCIVISLFVAGTVGGGPAGKSMLKERAEKYEAPASILQGGGIQLEEGTEEGQGGGATGGGLQLGEEILPDEESAPAGEEAPSGTAGAQ
ncbi:MAG: preprotein translocase subunit SecG [Chitinivibrionales bacterium]|nr:preprotein translocase subunit SecG [Chitinivibrionales bacterium]